MERASPLLRSINTLLLSIIVYSFFFGIQFSILFVGMLAIHEMGHYIAFRIKGIPCSFPIFIPFLGAVIYPGKMERVEDEAYTGYGGPLLGGLAAIALFGVWFLTGKAHTVLLLVSFFAVVMNLFNLIPVRPLDGGSVVKAIGGWVKYIGLATLLAFIVLAKSPILLLVLIAALGEIKMNATLRFWIGFVCQIAMSALFFFKISTFVFLTLIVAMCISMLMNARYLHAAKNNIEICAREEAGPPWKTRVLWALLYLGLIALLGYVAFLQFPLATNILTP
ncbi:MAG: hypothetical protein Q7R79_04855 [bacterium]|nr:hypothetical protein [bacterium]